MNSLRVLDLEWKPSFIVRSHLVLVSTSFSGYLIMPAGYLMNGRMFIVWISFHSLRKYCPCTILVASQWLLFVWTINDNLCSWPPELFPPSCWFQVVGFLVISPGSTQICLAWQSQVTNNWYFVPLVFVPISLMDMLAHLICYNAWQRLLCCAEAGYQLVFGWAHYPWESVDTRTVWPFMKHSSWVLNIRNWFIHAARYPWIAA